MPERIPGQALRSSSGTPQRVTVSVADAGRRLDLYLASRLPELSRTRIQELIDEGRVRVGDLPPKRAQRIAAGDVIEIEMAPRAALAASPEEIPIELLYEDDDLVVVNKPAGMVVHAGAGVSSGTLVNALLYRLGKLSAEAGVVRPGIVHAKTLVVDGRVVLVGSANMDLRSFRLNFEVHTLVHDTTTADAIRSTFRAEAVDSRQVELAAWTGRPWTLRVKEGAARLVSPLL